MGDGDMDFSGLDGMDDIDWSDVAADLEKNKEMIKSAASGGDLNEASGGGGESSAVAGSTEVGLDFLMDIPLQLQVEVGGTLMMVKDLLAMDIDSVFELGKQVGDPMDIKINDKLVARGEIIIQNEKFGIKILEILDKQKRLSSLKQA